MSNAALAKPGRSEAIMTELVEPVGDVGHLWFRKDPGGSVEDGYTGAGGDEAGVWGSL